MGISKILFSGEIRVKGGHGDVQQNGKD